jgi:predicted DsbA family dithiol-disulfide isomerase
MNNTTRVKDHSDTSDTQRVRFLTARLGITHVPSFLINGAAIFGTQPTAVFRQAIDAALAGRH